MVADSGDKVGDIQVSTGSGLGAAGGGFINQPEDQGLQSGAVIAEGAVDVDDPGEDWWSW